jgi:hypothetical protein
LDVEQNLGLHIGVTPYWFKLIKKLSPLQVGTLRFYGHTELGGGDWCGIELDRPEGLNDGSVRGVRYYQSITT